MHRPTYDIVGAGGIGCAMGYALLQARANVRFVDVVPKKIDAGNDHGVSVDESSPLSAPFISFADWEPKPEAVVLLCTKCYDNADVLARVPNSVTLIPVQNGFDGNLDVWGHSWEGIASFVSECDPHRPHTRITRAGKLHLGGRKQIGDGQDYQQRCGHPPLGKEGSQSYSPPYQGGAGGGDDLHQGKSGIQRTNTLATLAELLKPSDLFRVVVVDEILPYKYTKLMYNAAISPLAASAGIDNGDLLADPLARKLFFDLLRENYRILSGARIPLATIGPFHPSTVSRILRRRWLARLMAWAFTPSLRGTYCSMAPDLPKGRTEISYYNQHLIDLAGDEPCPMNRAVVDLIQRMERERLVPSRGMIADLANCI